MDAIAPAMAGEVRRASDAQRHRAFRAPRRALRIGAHLMGGTCQINATLRPDGTVVHGGKLQRLLFGERDRSDSARARAFAAEMAKTASSGSSRRTSCRTCGRRSCSSARSPRRRASSAAPWARSTPRRAEPRRWCARSTPTSRSPRREGHRPAAAGDRVRPHAASPIAPARGVRRCCATSKAAAASRRDHIVGWMLERARAHGIDDTILSLAFTHLKAYEARRDAGRLPGR